jgi:hypothetical protein
MLSARELANRLRETRLTAGDWYDTTAIEATERLSLDDLQTIRQMVRDAGYEGVEVEPKVRRVQSLVVGQIEALADNLPADGAD